MRKDILQLNDIGYRGPFSYRGIRIFALLAMTVSQIAAILLGCYKIAGYLGPQVAAGFFTNGQVIALNICKVFGAITFPLLLIASMSIVIHDRKKIFLVMLSDFLLAVVTTLFITVIADDLVRIMLSRLPAVLGELPNLKEIETAVLTTLIENAKASNSGFIGSLLNGESSGTISLVLSALTGEEIGADIVSNLIKSFSSRDFAQMAVEIIPGIVKATGLDLQPFYNKAAEFVMDNIVRSHMNINVFLDLFLCTVFFFFADYKPKKVTGGKLLLFRCCAVFPMLYLFVGIVLTGMNRAHMIDLPIWVVGILPSRKIPGILLFLFMVLYVKYHEAELVQSGGTQEDISGFMQSNRNSLRFSIFISVVLIVLSALDYGLSFIPRLSGWSVGSSAYMFLAIPFVLLFSYNRQTKLKFLDVLYPIYYILNYFIIAFVLSAIMVYLPELLANVGLK